MAPIRVGLVGASGETGTSILNGLLNDGSFEITALVRPSSISKKANQAIEARGVELRPLDLTGSHSSMVSALQGIEVLLSAIGPFDQLAQIPLATAAQEAGVKRFLPCGYITVMPPGIHRLRDEKELVYNHVKRLGLPYTIIDCGWWYQISFPPLPSGKIDYAISIPSRQIPGDGKVLSALTDVRDIGAYVARVAKDERTLNKYVLVYNELWSPSQVYDKLEELSGEKLEREYVSRAVLEERIQQAQAKIAADPELLKDFNVLVMEVGSQYSLSFGIRGDNTPEYAKYLGYVTSKELYPDMEFVKYEDYLGDLLAGKAKGVYEDPSSALGEGFKELRK